jgi:hypothetical protein
MNRKQLGILLGLVVIVGGAGLMVYQQREHSWQPPSGATGGSLLANLPVNDITRLVLRQGTNEVNLIKQSDAWRVRERHDYPANFTQISEFLLKARDLKVVQTEKVGPSQLPRLHLAPSGPDTNAALVVEFKGAGDKTLSTLLVGKTHLRKSSRPSPDGESDGGFPDGRYVMTAEPGTVSVISDPLESLQPRPESWLNKDFIKIEKARSLTVTFPAATNSWKLSRETESGDWKLADLKPGEALDSAKTSAFATPLSSPSINDVISGDTLTGGGVTTVSVDTFDGFHYDLKVGAKRNDDLPLTVSVSANLPKQRAAAKDEKPADKDRLDKEFKAQSQKLEEKLKQEQTHQGWTHLISSWSLESLVKERAQLMVEKKEEPKTETPGFPQPGEAPHP